MSTATIANIAPLATWRQLLHRLLRSTGGEAQALRASLAGLVAASAVQGLALACVFPMLAALSVTAQRASDVAAASRWLLAFMALALIASALRWRAQGFDFQGHMARATHALRTRLGEQLRRMPLEAIQDKRAGELNAALLGNVDENFNYTLTVANLIAQVLVMPPVLALALMFVEWRLGLALLLVYPPVVVLYRWRRPYPARGMRALEDAHRRANADIVEYTQGLPVLRAARCEGEKAVALQASFAQVERVQTIGQRKAAGPKMIFASVVELGLLATAAPGASWVATGTLEPALLAAWLVVLVRFSEPLANFLSYTNIVELVEVALDRIEALLAVSPLPQRVPVRTPTSFGVQFEGVRFHYAGQDPACDAPVLCDFSADLPERGMTALVGPSGSGKTTITRLLMRHADPQAGRVLIGGVDLREMTPDVLNGLISTVFQDVYLFDDTVIANIHMARPDASDEAVREAARAAQCLDFIERLPQGWDTRLGDIGARLSGGERQRISIARALLKDAPIVILDEPTAALDTESELAVQQAIDALVESRTVIVIAHRLSTIAAADRVLVIDDGRLVQKGRHDELIAQQGRYRAMWSAQQRAKAWHVRHAGPAERQYPGLQ